MLVVNSHALRAVDLLDFPEDIFLNGVGPHDFENFARVKAAVGNGLALFDLVPVLNRYALVGGNEVFLDALVALFGTLGNDF